MISRPVGAQSDDGVLASRAEALAGRLLRDATAQRTRRERVQGRRIARMLADPAGLAFIVALTDEVLRIRDPRRAARHLRDLVGSSPPTSLGPLDALALRVGTAMADRLPSLVMPLVRARVRAELAGFVIPAEAGPLARHIRRRQAAGIRLNLNVLGEAVLGDVEADARLESVLALLARPDVDYVSVKVSSVCSQLNVLAFEAEVDRVAHQVRRLYDAALAVRPHKFVNLDMEEYRDLHLTVAVFRRLLDDERYLHLDAGIVLQAYIPDSLPVLSELVAWARRRHERGGAAIKIRLVKGANLAMERVEAELAGWPAAPFATKAEVDTNYKRMLDVALDAANLGAVRVGVATHNLFEAAWALTVARDRGVEAMVEMEMLEGMAPSLAAAVRVESGGLLLYAPIARRRDSESVIAYLVRRFDENTGPENFLRNQFSLTLGSDAWRAERDRFAAAVAARHAPTVPTRRVQDRHLPSSARPLGWATEAGRSGGSGAAPEGFTNEADTDFSLVANRRWVEGYLLPLAELGIREVPAVVAGRVEGPGQGRAAGLVEDPLEGRVGGWMPGFDPADPAVVAYRWARSDVELVDRAVAAAGPAGERWRARSAESRRETLLAVAASLVATRGRLIGVMARDGGKTVAEADPEVSEAIDFARYYAGSIGRIGDLETKGTRFRPYGIVVVVPPWNFPLAIPAGGILAALAAGSSVIVKPAPETVATAWVLAEACWQAGVPRDVLQFVPCADDDAGRRLVTHPGVDAIILTGSWETARMFLAWRPGLRLHAETSGKNAVVITAAADLDAAVADLVRSAFGHAGQKCSAASLAILEAPVYDDPAFHRQLADAVRTLRPGPGWDPTTTIGPLIRPPEGPLHDALHRLGPGETWLVEPRQLGDNPRLWSPGVKLGVRPGSSFHLTECFGPVLGVMRAADLTQAIAWQNEPAYGLTAGLHSLDPAEIRRWRDQVEAGNLYVNRHITGAIVRRQPFGGWKRSVIGPGPKAGGPNYVASLGTWTIAGGSDGTLGAAAGEGEAGSGASREGTRAQEASSFEAAVAEVWDRDGQPVDPSRLAAEADIFRYLPLRRVLLHAGGDAGDRDLALALAAARALGVVVVVSSDRPRPKVAVAGIVEDDAALMARIAGVRTDKVRFLGTLDDGLRLVAHDAGLWVDDEPVVERADLEFRRWVREQSLSETRHRHGDPSPRLAGSSIKVRQNGYL